MTQPLPRPNAYLVVTGSGDPHAIDAYLYGDNQRTVTLEGNHRFVTIVAVYTTGGFGSGPQGDRLESGLYAARFRPTFEEAAAEALTRAVLAGIATDR